MKETVGEEREGKISRVLTSDSLYWKEGGLKWKVNFGKLLL